MFFALKKWIRDRISRAAGFSNLLNIKTTLCVNTVQMSATCVRALTKNQTTRHASAPSWPQPCSGNIRKTELTFWITYVHAVSAVWGWEV
jgi:hypothetical protein